MMRECQESTMRESLPALARGRLPADEAARLRAHVARCEACRAELAILEASARVFDAATPRPDVAAILRALPAATPTPTLRLVPSAPRSRRWAPRYAMAAAASLVLVASLSWAGLRDRLFDATPATGVGPDTALPATPTVPVALVGGSELADLGEADLEALLTELEQLEATVAAEPVTMQRPVVQAPEGL